MLTDVETIFPVFLIWGWRDETEPFPDGHSSMKHASMHGFGARTSFSFRDGIWDKRAIFLFSARLVI